MFVFFIFNQSLENLFELMDFLINILQSEESYQVKDLMLLITIELFLILLNVKIKLVILL